MPPIGRGDGPNGSGVLLMSLYLVSAAKRSGPDLAQGPRRRRGVGVPTAPGSDPSVSESRISSPGIASSCSRAAPDATS